MLTGFVPSPSVIVFDVNETLSDLTPMTTAFEAVGVPADLAPLWFAEVLRDGFGLCLAGAAPRFVDVAEGAFRHVAGFHTETATAWPQVLDAFMSLPVHDDVVPGVRALAAAGLRLVTLSNGSASVAEGLLERTGLTASFERILTVEDAGAWKPHPDAYRHALVSCGVEADDTMLVAAHPWDVDGARRAGLRGGWLNRGMVNYPSHLLSPDAAAHSLPELAEQLTS